MDIMSALKEFHKTDMRLLHKDLDADINNIVDSLPNDQIGWAMQQVKNSLIIAQHGSYKREDGVD